MNIVQRGQQGFGLHLAQLQVGTAAHRHSSAWLGLNSHLMGVSRSAVKHFPGSREQEPPFSYDSQC